ncbi:MAG TPA: GNAT family N-acetyltransferase [Actinomycetales bacterium]|nr:GNAT family N-acetyltransferase [Actinomycetales bacterium]
MTFVVRAARPEDADGIAHVHVAAWRVGYRGLLPGAFLSGLSVEQRTSRWQAILAQPSEPPAQTLLAERDGSVVGFASVGPARDEGAGATTGELWAIYVHPDHWRSGAGHALHERAMEVLRDAGRTDATLWVLAGNERAAAFYARHGWAPDGATKTDWRDDVRLDELRYRRSLLESGDA